MKFTSFSVASLALIAGAFAAPAKRAGPSGTLVTPNDGADWDNSSQFGLGHVIYQGVDQDYNFGDYSHVKTHHIDIYLEAQDGSAPTYLAKGIAPNSNNIVDEQFQIPFGYGGKLGQYRLVIEETQEATTPGFPEAITFRAAAPMITITAGPVP